MAKHPVVELTSEASWNFVEDKFSTYGKDILATLVAFLQDEVYPCIRLAHSQIPRDPDTRWRTVVPVIETLKSRARALGLWNLFLSRVHYPAHGVPLSNVEVGILSRLCVVLAVDRDVDGAMTTRISGFWFFVRVRGRQYAVMAEVLGRGGHVASEVVNCSAPDTGNMEVLARYGSPEQQQTWLVPLLNGEIRSSFAMTERFVSSSDARNIKTSIRREGDEIVVTGHKWWISGAGDPRTRVHLVMGLSNPENPDKYKQHSVVIVPADAPGVRVLRPMEVFGYDDAPEGHCEVVYDSVRVPVGNLVLGWGRGFEIIQGRLGPGRIHHCMRSIGAASYALDLMIERVTDPTRKTFGKQLYEHGTVVAEIAQSRAEIEAARLLVLSAAHQIDKHQAKGAMKEIGIAKFVVPRMACEVVDRAIQAFGAEGLSQDQELASMYAQLRTLRLADGPDAVHIQQVGQRELRRAAGLRKRTDELRRKEAVALEKARL